MCNYTERRARGQWLLHPSCAALVQDALHNVEYELVNVQSFMNADMLRVSLHSLIDVPSLIDIREHQLGPFYLKWCVWGSNQTRRELIITSSVRLRTVAGARTRKRAHTHICF